MTGAITQDRESCQFPFLLVWSIVFLVDENPNVASAGLGGVVVGGARSVPDRAARSNSERAAPSACVGKRFSALRLSGGPVFPLFAPCDCRGHLQPGYARAERHLRHPDVGPVQGAESLRTSLSSEVSTCQNC